MSAAAAAAIASTLSLITPNPLGGYTNGNTIIASSYLSPPHYSKPNPNFSSLFSFSVSLSSSNNFPKHKPSLSSRQTTVSIPLSLSIDKCSLVILYSLIFNEIKLLSLSLMTYYQLNTIIVS
jgi:hypothetical protein